MVSSIFILYKGHENSFWSLEILHSDFQIRPSESFLFSYQTDGLFEQIFDRVILKSIKWSTVLDIEYSARCWHESTRVTRKPSYVSNGSNGIFNDNKGATKKRKQCCSYIGSCFGYECRNLIQNTFFNDFSVTVMLVTSYIFIGSKEKDVDDILACWWHANRPICNVGDMHLVDIKI